MSTKANLLSDDFFKDFKTGDELNAFIKQLQKRGSEMMLEGELDAHFGYNKHEKSTSSNARNGYGTKKIKTSSGDMDIRVPRDRDASFDPIVVSKRRGMAEGIENVIISLYSKGMTVSDIE